MIRGGRTWILYAGLIVAVITATIGITTSLTLVDTATFLGLELILTVGLETLQRVDEQADSILGPDGQNLKPSDVATMRNVASGLIKARQVDSDFMQGLVDDAVDSLTSILVEIGTGRAAFEPASSGFFYSEIDFIAQAKTQARVTSCVDATRYWKSAHGAASIALNRTAIARGVKITRIFIEDHNRLEDLHSIVSEHRAAGIECRVAIRDQIPESCVRDFAILDNGYLSVTLELDDSRMPSITRFVTSATEVGRSEIRRLEDIYRVLTQRSMPADDFLDERAR